MLLDIKNFFLNKYNLALILIAVSALAYSLFIGRPPKEILNLFAFALFCLVIGIHPFINKKDMYAGGTAFLYNGDKLDKWLRLSIFITSGYAYIAILFNMVNG